VSRPGRTPETPRRGAAQASPSRSHRADIVRRQAAGSNAANPVPRFGQPNSPRPRGVGRSGDEPEIKEAIPTVSRRAAPTTEGPMAGAPCSIPRARSGSPDASPFLPLRSSTMYLTGVTSRRGCPRMSENGMEAVRKQGKLCAVWKLEGKWTRGQKSWKSRRFRRERRGATTELTSRCGALLTEHNHFHHVTLQQRHSVSRPSLSDLFRDTSQSSGTRSSRLFETASTQSGFSRCAHPQRESWCGGN
jgi:hypothetical protein